MRFLSAIVGFGFALAARTAASPVVGRPSSCLLPSDVDTLVGAYVSLISNYTDAAATSYLAPSFTDTSDSIDILAGIPLGSVTFPSRQAFMQKEEQQPDALPIKISSVGPCSCNQIALIWTAAFGAGKPVRGITIITGVPSGKQWQIQALDVEFDSIAYLLNIGGTYTMPAQ